MHKDEVIGLVVILACCAIAGYAALRDAAANPAPTCCVRVHK